MPHSIVYRSAEVAVAGTEQYGDSIIVIIGRDQVGITVPVEITHGHRLGATSYRIVHCRIERQSIDISLRYSQIYGTEN
jgi:citrate lyase gamma subunit